MGKPFKEAYIPNEHIAELQAKYSKHLIGFGSIDTSNTKHNAVEETIRCAEKLGLKGIFIERAGSSLAARLMSGSILSSRPLRSQFECGMGCEGADRRYGG